eukprot:COSAG02_NODE_12522_length_1533_cov_1.463040_2_plen_70_part_00
MQVRPREGSGVDGWGACPHRTHVKAKVVQALDIALVIFCQFDMLPTCTTIQVPKPREEWGKTVTISINY